MMEALLALLSIAVIVLTATVILLYRRIWLLMGSIECLCTNLGRLRQQMGQGGHEHAA
jgi:hypothetical protein